MEKKQKEKYTTQWFVAARSHMFPLPLRHMLRMLQTIAIFKGFLFMLFTYMEMFSPEKYSLTTLRSSFNRHCLSAI